MSKKIVNIQNYRGKWEDIWGVEGDKANVLIMHNPKNNRLKIHAVDVNNNVIDIEFDSTKAINLMMAFEDALEPKKNT